jgi:hypothetical protein
MQSAIQDRASWRQASEAEDGDTSIAGPIFGREVGDSPEKQSELLCRFVRLVKGWFSRNFISLNVKGIENKIKRSRGSEAKFQGSGDPTSDNWQYLTDAKLATETNFFVKKKSKAAVLVNEA